jgi:hypothetical protein
LDVFFLALRLFFPLLVTDYLVEGFADVIFDRFADVLRRGLLVLEAFDLFVLEIEVKLLCVVKLPGQMLA